MKTSLEYLDEAKAKIGIVSDYAFAKEIGVTRGAMSNYRNKVSVMDDFTASKIAETLEINPMMIIAAANAEREKDDEKRGYWEKYYKRLGGLAASIFLVVNLIMTPTPSQAAPMLDVGVTHCILCKIIETIKKAIKQTALSLVSQVSRFRELIPRVCQPAA